MPALSELSDAQLRALEREQIPLSEWTDEELDGAARAATSTAAAQASRPDLTLAETARAAGAGAVQGVRNVGRAIAQEPIVRESLARFTPSRETVATAFDTLPGPAAGAATALTGYGLPAAAAMTGVAAAAGRDAANRLRGTYNGVAEPLAYGATQALGVALPGVGRVTSPAFAANAPRLAAAAEVAAPMLAAGAAGTGLTVAYQGASGQDLDWKEALKAGGVTALLGGIGGGIRAAEVTKLASADRDGLVAQARRYGFKGKDFDEMRAWYRESEAAADILQKGRQQNARPVSPNAPAEEGAMVPRGQIQPLADAPAPAAPSAPAIVPRAPVPVAPAPVAPVAVVPPVPAGQRPEPSFYDQISGRIETPEAALYMRRRLQGAKERWDNLSPQERAVAHSEFGTTNQVMIDKGSFPFDSTPSRFSEIVGSIEAARAPAPAPANQAPEIPLDQQILDAQQAASRASSRFREAGKWADLKGQPARQRWQVLKSQKLETERNLEDLQRKADNALPAAPAAPNKPVAEMTDAELEAAAQALMTPPAGPAPAAPGGDLFGDMPFNLASEQQRAPVAPVAPTQAPAEMFGAEVRGTAPTALDRANEAARAQAPAAAPAPQAPAATSATTKSASTKISEYTAKEWDSLAEELVDASDLAGGAGGREGRASYELEDVVQEFVEAARATPNLTIEQAFKAFASESEASKKRLGQLRSILADHKLLGAPALPPGPVAVPAPAARPIEVAGEQGLRPTAPRAPGAITPTPAAPEVHNVYNVRGYAVQIPADQPPPADMVTADQWFALAPLRQSNPERFRTNWIKTLADNARLAKAAARAAKAPAGPVRKERPFGGHPDGTTVDLIDAVMDAGGIPRPPKVQRGGEFNGFKDAFQGPARKLIATGPGGNWDTWVQNLADVAQRPDLRTADPQTLAAALDQAFEDRRNYKAAGRIEDQEGRFYQAAMGQARGSRPGREILAQELPKGATLKLDRETFTVSQINSENGNVTLRDGPKYGTQIMRPDASLYPDKGSLRGPDGKALKVAKVKPAAPTPPADEGEYEGFGAPDFNAAPPMGAPGGPPKNQGAAPAPADDPDFTQLPIELPEAVQFFKVMAGGQYPAIREKLRALGGNAAGVFYYKEGDPASGRIELRADLFNLVSVAEKQELLRQAVAWAELMKQANPGLNKKEAIRAKFEELVRAAEVESIAKGPARALATFWHEIGHFLDFYGNATTKRGNILGRLASLNHYMKAFIANRPGLNSTPPDAAALAKLRRQAEKELTADVQTIVETIRREEKVYREVPITPAMIADVVKNLAREDFPEFYDWFAKLDRATKVAVLRNAMKGIVDERAAKFGRREATGEVRVVEETVTRTTGGAPTPEAIRERYRELLKAELEARGLVSEKEIRAELEGAIAWWRGTDKVPEYFKPSVELWADTMSIFFNNPRALAQRAPKFYQAFLQWMAVKPGLREEYDAVQNAIKSGQIHRDRVMNLRDMFKRDETAGGLLDEFATRTTRKDDLDMARLLFDRQFGPIERRIGRNPKDLPGQRARDALGDFQYRATAWEGFAYAVRNQVEMPLAAASLTHDDMAEYLFHRRITEGRYRNLAAPLGWNPKNSGERLAEMERTLGPDRWRALVSAQTALRAVYEKQVVALLHRSGVLSPELAKAIDDEIFYAPFNSARVFTGGNLDAIEELVKVRYGNEAAGQIYSATGNLGEIRSPYVQLMHRALGLISMAHKQLAIKSVVNFLRAREPLSVADAPTRWNGKQLEPVKVQNSRVSTLFMLNGGKVEAVYVPRVIGEMFVSGGPLEARMIAVAQSVLSTPKAMLTELNPGFWPVAFAKDIWGAAVQLPGGSRILAELPRAYLASYRRFYGRPDAVAQLVLDRQMVISRADSRGEHLGHADEMTRILLRLGKSPVQWNAEVTKIERVLRAFWRGWSQQGQIFEGTVKIASMRALDRQFPDMPEGVKRELVRERGGSPNFLGKGRWAAVVELGLNLLFYNAWKEALRSMKRAATEDPRGFWSKFAATVGAAGLVMWAMERGLVGTDEEAGEHRDMMRSIPEADKLRGLVIPLGWNDREAGKVAYLVLPFPDSLRWAHAALRKSLQSSVGSAPAGEGLGSFVQYQGQDLPGENPWVGAASELYEYYVKNRNPYDNFTGRPALDQTRVDAGEADEELAKRTISRMTGGVVYRYRNERPGEQLTDLEEFLKQPVVSNLLGRWVRVSNRGLSELYNQAAAPTAKQEAQMQLVGEEMIKRTMTGEPWSKEQVALYGVSEYLVNYIDNAAPRLAMQADSPYLRALSQAKTSAQKAAIWKAENARREAKLPRLEERLGVPAPAAP